MAGKHHPRFDAEIFNFRLLNPLDAHYMSSLWPEFVIDAEAETIAQRASIVDTMGHLWWIWRCKSVPDAFRVLCWKDIGLGVLQRTCLWLEFV